MIAVSDTGPLNYLILIGTQDILHDLFREVLIPQEVFIEMNSPKAPSVIRQWIQSQPSWLKIQPMEVQPRAGQATASGLQRADIACIELAQARTDCILLVDDRLAKQEATSRGVSTSGTLALIFLAGEMGLLDFDSALTDLEKTSFRARKDLRAHYRERWQNLVRPKR